ncbi:MAG: alpha/beta hydrolase [Gammaproteobacteria bacterium]|nr:alpha/beta hydrolase [Gammaproteobacteria bacterium]
MKRNIFLAILPLVLVVPSVFSPGLADEFADQRLTLESLRQKYGDPDGRIAEIGGVEVYYKDQGEGPAILMIHGSRSSLRTWDRVAPEFLDRYRVIRYDLPPNGLSGPVSDEAVDRMEPADLAVGLLDHVGADEVTCVGVSSGGTTCMYLAATYPDRVNRLIMSNSPSDPVTTDHVNHPPAFKAALDEFVETGFESENFINLFLDFYSGDPRRISEQTRSEYYDFNRRVREPNPIAMIGLVADHEKTRKAMASVRAPALLIWGGRDALLIPAAAGTLARYLENTQVSTVFMPDVGHYPPLESPVRFARIVAAYLEAATPVDVS